METEIWKPIPDFELIYEVSNLGRIRSIKTGLIRKFYTNDRGYKYTILSNRTQKCVRINRMVMFAFCGKSDLQVDHIDRDKGNNRLDNLRYLTPRQNIHEKIRSKKSLGYSFNSKAKKYVPTISFNGKQYTLGYFDSADLAIQEFNRALIEVNNGSFKTRSYRHKWVNGICKFCGIKNTFGSHIIRTKCKARI